MYHSPRRALLFVLALAIPGAAARAQGRSSVHPTTPPVAAAAPLVGAIVIDGRLDEPAWQAATPVTAFSQTQPDEGRPATQRTEVRFLYDGDALYVGARMYDSLGARGVHARLARRDEMLDLDNGQSAQITCDNLTLILDPYHDHLTRAVFEITPRGVIGDALGEGGSNLDASWDPVWQYAARIDSLGWTAELRIPFSQLHFSRDSVQTWGLQLMRYVERLNERDQWAFWRHNESGGPSRYGHLTNLIVRHRPRQLELMPYAVSRVSYQQVAAGNPFTNGRDVQYHVGGDIKYLLTSNLTLDATVNPDFGQVEVDPAVVNLTAYETFFPEKRPFFVAGSGAFDFGSFSCFFCSNVSSLDVFYSRRIGRPPQLGSWVTGTAQYADVPSNAKILGAAKITGRTAGNFTVGVLDAVTSAEQAAYLLDGSTTPRQQEVEPLTNYFVGRLKRDFDGGATTVGAILTSTSRRLGDSLETARLRSHAEVGGLDLFHAWDARTYDVMASVALSSVSGSPASIAQTMQSSAHYFQRPDRKETSDGLFDTRFDTTRTSLRGYAAYARIAKDNGDWLWETQMNLRSPGFEVNDLAFLSQADYVWMSANLARQWTVPTKAYRNIFTSFGGQQKFDYDGNRTDRQLQYYIGVTLPNYWNVNAFEIWRPSVYDDQLMRGGPVVMRDGVNFANASVSTDSRKLAVVSVQGDYFQGGHDRGHHGYDLFASVLLKPASNVSVSIGPSLSVGRSTQQYVTTIADPTAVAFYGNRYVFASIAQTTLAVETRFSLTVTPRLTLELYVQPLLASGSYFDFKEFARPRSIETRVYGQGQGTIAAVRDSTGAVTRYTVDPDGGGPAAPFAFDNPNFNTRSLRGNAVLRWEYRPGSTIYLVWTQLRENDGSLGAFNLGADTRTLMAGHPDDVFLLKVSYWFGR